MTATLRRSASLFASLTFLGLALTTATGCGAAATAATKVASPSDVSGSSGASDTSNAADTSAPADATEATAVAEVTISPAADADAGVKAKKEEIAGLQALVDQEKQALAAKDLAAGDRKEHLSTLRNLVKMKAGSEAELAVLEKPFAVPAVAAAPTAKVALTSATLPGAPKLPGTPKLPGVPSVPGVPGAAVPGLPAAPGLGSVAALGSSPKGAAMGLAKLGASRIPGGGAAFGAASALAGGDPKGAAMGLAKLGASHLPGGGAALGAASAAANLASDPKGAAKDLAKQGASAALNKVPIPGALKGSLFGGLTK